MFAPDSLRRHVAACLLLLPSLATAAPIAEVRVSGARIELGELLPSAPNLMHGIDIGPAPAPGASRLVSRDSVVRQVRAAGFDPTQLDLQGSLRARRDGKKYGAEELGELITPAVEAALPPGVTLMGVNVSASMTLENITLAPIRMPKLPKRAGVVKVAFGVEFLDGATGSRRLPVTAVLSQSEEATQSNVTRGQRVQLVIRHGAVRIAAESIALSDGDIGDELRFRVVRTGKVLLGRLDSLTSAIVSEGR